MADVKEAFPVKYFVGALYRSDEHLAAALDLLRAAWGGIDFQGKDHPFDVTAYYEPEMGAPLFRRIISLEKLLDPLAIVRMKLDCNLIETQTAVQGKRTVNLDAGYLDHNKILLASAKEAGQKVYLGQGIYADLAGRYRGGKYQPFEWSFPDFRDGRYDSELLQMRSGYLEQVRTWKKNLHLVPGD